MHKPSMRFFQLNIFQQGKKYSIACNSMDGSVLYDDPEKPDSEECMLLASKASMC